MSMFAVGEPNILLHLFNVFSTKFFTELSDICRNTPAGSKYISSERSSCTIFGPIRIFSMLGTSVEFNPAISL
jgi:hypothetical protein